ncbi:uncharacterized protein EDB91DRAFT_1237367 [Suillus paluster]|uniref:uncharacterized protein n=1 Tax=Suillus paluster TaxID=48578 RepID=UPI001B8713B4|nr:uncharacterized protein EDB91DRAFT_1237367 [Suillus paluster]KAG1740171.1 hypothetical protein EDB91DRAFT_1237367 [Suillus paluster]
MPANSANPSAAKTDLQGLELAEHHFGPLLHPTRATQSAWTNYSTNRLQTMKKYRTVVTEPGKNSEDGSEEDSEEHEYSGYSEYSDEAWLLDSVQACVFQIEKEMDLEEGTLQKCIAILGHDTVIDDVKPRSTDHIIRIYSSTAPMYIDVHFQYHCRPRWSKVEWCYSLGYKIQRRPPATAANQHLVNKELSRDAAVPEVHMRNGWQTLCWGYYDGCNGNYGKNWRYVEVGKVELRKEGVLDIHEALFGDLEKPAETDSEAMLAYHRSLVRSIRLLLAAVGISYEVACTDDESDDGPRDLMLEGLSDRWVGRGIRNACGLRLTRDAEEERKGAQKRQEEAKGDPEDDEDSDDDEDGSSGDDDFGL